MLDEMELSILKDTIIKSIGKMKNNIYYQIISLPVCSTVLLNLVVVQCTLFFNCTNSTRMWNCVVGWGCVDIQ